MPAIFKNVVGGAFFLGSLFITAFLGSIFLMGPVLPLMIINPRLYRIVTDHMIGIWIALPVVSVATSCDCNSPIHLSVHGLTSSPRINLWQSGKLPSLPYMYPVDVLPSKYVHSLKLPCSKKAKICCAHSNVNSRAAHFGVPLYTAMACVWRFNSIHRIIIDMIDYQLYHLKVVIMITFGFIDRNGVFGIR